MSPSIHLNPLARTWAHEPASAHATAAEAVLAFHRTIPQYNETRLRALPAIAAELGLGHVLLKDESDRFGLPAFKILGASWAVYRAVAVGLGIPVGEDGGGSGSVPFREIGEKAKRKGLRIVTATEGNCGRAVARMATRHMGLSTRVYVPKYMNEDTRAKIQGEGGEEGEEGRKLVEVIEVDGSYDDVIPVVLEDGRASDGNAIMVLDVGVEGWNIVPRYFVQGYSTMLAESDRQVFSATDGKSATHAIVPVGAGSIGEAVTAHFKDFQRREEFGEARILAVEPTTAACLLASLRTGESASVPTSDTIMCGMNCGTLSTTAWPVLRDGVDAAVTVEDVEAHDAVEELKRSGIRPGPCGAATLAALRRVRRDEHTRKELGLDKSAIVVLYCTEGERDYEIPA
ncbi:hypothetical protein AAE478_009940 [Parahypoxylon ruwenzoriense]